MHPDPDTASILNDRPRAERKTQGCSRQEKLPGLKKQLFSSLKNVQVS
jgi:hypothetical protein